MKQGTLKHLKPAAPTLAAALTLAMAFSFSPPALAAENMDPIEWCSRAVSESARITCLEEALRNKTGQTPDVAGAPSEDKSGVSVPPRAVSNSATENGETPAATPVERKKSLREKMLDKLGKKEVKKRKGEDSEKNERLTAHVSTFKFVGYKKLWVKLDNGQIWQQKKSDRSTLESRLKRFDEFDVELWRTGFGGYRLHIPEIDKTLAVNRLN